MPNLQQKPPASLHWRLAFYLLLSGITVLALTPVFAILSLAFLGLPLLIGAASFYLLFYLPLIDWPYIAWRYSGNALVALAAFMLALAVPFGFPLIINAQLDGPRNNEVQQLPDHPIDAHNLLMVGEGSFSNVDSCGEVCQVFLWSGATDHVLAKQSVGLGQHLDGATLYTVGRSSTCESVDSRKPQSPRNGFCIVGRSVTNPSFDSLIQITRSFNSSTRRLPFHTKEHQLPDFLNLQIYDCRSDCHSIANVLREAGEYVAMPVLLHFEGGIDTGGPFGLFFARQPFVLHPLAETVQKVFGLDVSDFAPRPDFSGDISHGGPLTPDPRDELRRAATSYRPVDLAAEGRADQEAAAEQAARYRAVVEAHKDCAWPVIQKGRYPEYLGCQKLPLPFALPSFLLSDRPQAQ